MTVKHDLAVLVLEDHGSQRRTTAGMLRLLGVREVFESADGVQALAVIGSAGKIDLVICDLEMPGMDGLEFLRHLGQSCNAASVVVNSAHESALVTAVETMAHAYGVQMLGALKKPVTLQSLEDLIARHHRLTALRLAENDSAYPAFSIDEILDGLRHEQFEPYFQPKMDLATGRILGAEALARWHHPEHGIVAPKAFIAPLEQHGHIDELTDLMLKNAAGACCGWRERGWDYTVSVNLSSLSLRETAQADRITRVVSSAGLDPAYMTIEVTETTAIANLAPALENLTRLRMRGFGLSIDDYGTGYSSMQQLMRIPFTEMKIDQDFIRGWTASTAMRLVVESSIDMARALCIKCVAEGVETRVDLDALKDSGCDITQGYFIARPMSSDTFNEFCARSASISFFPQQQLRFPFHK